MKTPSHPWSFRQRLRTRAFGWRGSKLAIGRLKEALGEIKTVARTNPETAAEGAVLLMERLWPALQAVDSSSGALGNATNKTVHELIEILLVAPAKGARLERRLERLWTAIEEDGVAFLSEVRDRWGELCHTPERASRAADDFLPALRLRWNPEHRGYFRGTTPCLSCLLAAGRHQELLDLIETAPFLWWHFRRYGVRALAAQGRTDEAIDYAERSLGRNDGSSDMARTWEAILLAAGRTEEAYRRFAYMANRAGSHLATFRAIKKKYPDKAPRAILDDLIAQTPGEEGKWFATAKDLGLLELVLNLGPGPGAALPRGHRHSAASGPGPPGPRAGLHPGDRDYGPGLDGRRPVLRAEGRGCLAGDGLRPARGRGPRPRGDDPGSDPGAGPGPQHRRLRARAVGPWDTLCPGALSVIRNRPNHVTITSRRT
jgi:tetratricopeptide (TPR) repeat protein